SPSAAAEAIPSAPDSSGSIEIHAPDGRNVSAIRAQADEALRRFRVLFPDAAPRVAVVIVDSWATLESGDVSSELAERGVVCLPALEGGESGRRARPGLAHQIGHALFDSKFERAFGGPPVGCAQGSHGRDDGVIPPWIEEAVATWCEGLASRQERV